MRKRFLTFAAICAALLLVGSGCMSEDVDTLFGFLNDWAVGHNIVTADGKPTSQTIKYVGSGGFISTGDTMVDAATDAGAAMQSVVQTDQKLDDADAAMADNTQNGRAKALELSAEAVNDRPDDQEVRTRRGIILTESGNAAEGKKYLVAYSAACDPAKNSSMGADQQKQCLHNAGVEGDRLKEANSKGTYDQRNCAMLEQEADSYKRATDLARAAGDQATADKYSSLEIDALGRKCVKYTPPYDPDVDD